MYWLWNKRIEPVPVLEVEGRVVQERAVRPLAQRHRGPTARRLDEPAKAVRHLPQDRTMADSDNADSTSCRNKAR